MNSPNVASFSMLDQQAQATRFTVSTDIVDYMASARTFGREDLADPQQQGRFQRRVIAIPDRRSTVLTPMVLTIGNRNQLSLVRQDTTQGWQRIDLSRAFGNAQVQALGAAWTDDDRITIAVAMSDPAQPTLSRVFVAYDLSSQQTDWDNLPWIDCGTRSTLKLAAIRILDEGDRTWTIVLAGNEGANEAVYLMQRGQTFNQAFVFNPAVTLQTIFDFEVGVHPIFGGGLHVLGMSGGKRVLSFRPFPTYDKAGRIKTIPPIVVLPCPSGATVLESSQTRDGASDLYIAGQGTQMISADQQDQAIKAQVETVVPAQFAPNVEDLVVGDSGEGAIAVWTLLQNGDLNIVKRSATDSVQPLIWGAPLRLRQNVQEIAPIQGDRHTMTSLLIVYTNGRASYLWQDAATGVWQETPILVADAGDLTRVPCYGTSLRVLDAAGAPQFHRKVTVSASALCSVILNGETVFLSPTVSIATATDTNGSVSLYDAVQSLTPAVYRFSIESIQAAIEVNPAAGVQQRLHQITADEMRSATFTTPAGTAPLLPENFRTGNDRTQVDAIAAALNQVAKLTDATTGIVPGVQVVSASANYSSDLSLKTVPMGYQWGIEATAQGVKAATPSAIERLVKSSSTGEFFSNLGETIVDFFEGIGDRVKVSALFVLRKAEDAFEFVCQLGDQIKRFVLKTLEEAGAFFKWLWEQIKTGAEAVWEYLKFAFDWNDILLTRDAMVAATDDALKTFQANIPKLKTYVESGFDTALNQIETWRAEAGVPMTKVTPPAAGTSIFDSVKSFTDPIQALIDQATGNSVIAWVHQRMQSIAAEIIIIESPNPASETIAAVEAFVKGLVADGTDNIFSCWQQIQADLEHLFSHQLPTSKDLSFQLIRNVLIAVGANALVGLLKGLRDLLLRSIDLMHDLVGVMHDALFLKVRFPFVEKLIKLVLPNATIDASFRLIDGLMLLCAIPTTIAYKIMFGESPIKAGEKIPLLHGNIMVQSDTNKMRQLATFGAVGAAFVKLLISSYQTHDAVKEATGEATDAIVPVPVVLGVGAAFAGLGIAAEVMSRHTAQGSLAVEAVEWTMLGISSLIAAKGVATAIAAKFGNKETAAQVNDGIDTVSYAVHLLLQTAVFGIIIDDLRQSHQPEIPHERMSESLIWAAGMFDQGGSALISAGGVVKDVKVKFALIAAGSLSKYMAFGTGIGRLPLVF
jgi:hypothetical protein